VGRAPVRDSRVVFVTGTGLSHEPARDATLTAAATARAAGVPVVVDIDYRADQWDDAGAFSTQMRTLLRSATLAVGTEEELAAASGAADVATGAATVLDSGIQALILKRGARGSTIFRPKTPSADVAPFPIEVLNVLGAGDAFASGFLYGYLQGWTLERAARMGNACGAIVVTRHGCANFMPTLDEVSAFVSSRGEPAI
jgi:5-dehydro-2-deoxygluconokinase